MVNEVEQGSGLTGEVGGYGYINQTDLPNDDLLADPGFREVAEQLSRWRDNATAAAGKGSMFDRGAYTPPANFYDELRSARHAMQYDDVVSGVAEITEAFAFQGLKFEGASRDDSDVFNQWAKHVNLDHVVRSMWREEYAAAQFVCAVQWKPQRYRVRGESENGNKRKKTYEIFAPDKLTLLDSGKVVPVGFGPLGSDKLAWSSTVGEKQYLQRVKRGEAYDPDMDQFFLGPYEPDRDEKGELTKLGVDPENLLLMNPSMVWRHTFTKSDYERFPNVRLKPIFKLLDLKQQLVSSDRAMLVGAANYILLVRKGTDDLPARGEELAHLNKRFKFVARVPVIISDHRLQVDIVAPDTDFVLKADRYDTIDTRILARLLGTLSFNGSGQRNETNVTLSRAVARMMENRRHMMKRTLESRLVDLMVSHPLNAGVFEAPESPPKLVFTPRNIALDVNAAIVQAVMGLRQSREVSRETTLEYFGLDQATEAKRMEWEDEYYDDVFQSLVPYSGAQPGDATPGDNGRSGGGRPAGGGTSSANPGKPKTQTTNGNPSTGGDQ